MRRPRLILDGSRRIPIFLLIMATLLAWGNAIGAGDGEGDGRLLRTGFRKGPYLIYRGDPTRMQVLWQTVGTAVCTLQWGRHPQYMEGSVETTEYGDDHQHSHVITNITPGARVFYRVTTDETTHAASFFAAPANDATSVKFMVHGDTQANAADHDSVCAAMIGEYVADPAYQSLTLGVGDLSNFGMLESDWDQYFFNPAWENIRDRLAHVPFNTCIGNHELYESATTYDLTAPLFRKYFPYPFVRDRYWSFDYGPAHIILADLYPWYYDPGLPNIIPPGFISPEQAQWIENDLATSSKIWKFVFIHESGWSAGPHPNNPSVQDTLHPLCQIHGVDIVFAGHNHYYARAETDNITYLTTSGGAHLYYPAPGSLNVVASSRNHHYCKIEIAGSVLDLWGMSPDGEIIDQFTIVKNSGIATAPLAPQALRLRQNCPNPFGFGTSIPFTLDFPMAVELRVYDVAGRLVRTLVDESLPAGSHEIAWDGCDRSGRAMAPGIYWYQLATPEGATSRKLVIDR